MFRIPAPGLMESGDRTEGLGVIMGDGSEAGRFLGVSEVVALGIGQG